MFFKYIITLAGQKFYVYLVWELNLNCIVEFHIVFGILRVFFLLPSFLLVRTLVMPKLQPLPA